MNSSSLSRSSGILLHISSLPSGEGIGTLGSRAHEWVDRLAQAGQRLWQVLPIGPTGYGNSPYQSYSSRAGNPLLIDLEELERIGWLKREEYAELREGSAGSRVDFQKLVPAKERALRRAFIGFGNSATDREQREFRNFELSEVEWLEEYALFMALHRFYGDRPWHEWEEPHRRREHRAMEQAKREFFEEIEYRKFEQFCFFRQWESLRSHAAQRGVEIIGDLPIYVSYDSCDAWVHPELFLFDGNLSPRFVAGVPPDYFSQTGQLWGNPLYDWDRMAEEGYAWWVGRLRHLLRLFDRVRIDHFRGFEAYWAIPAGAKSAAEGEWRPGPGEELFEALLDALGGLPLIAEDLGIITPEVEALRDRFGLPGMKVLQFAFGGDSANPYLPHNHIPNAVLYTGTHDNDTSMGWFRSLEEKGYLLEYLASSEERFLWDWLRIHQSSVCAWAILPLQDLLGLGSDARMNVPGTTEGNWAWRCTPEQMHKLDVALERLGRLSRLYGRA